MNGSVLAAQDLTGLVYHSECQAGTIFVFWTFLCENIYLIPKICLLVQVLNTDI